MRLNFGQGCGRWLLRFVVASVFVLLLVFVQNKRSAFLRQAQSADEISEVNLRPVSKVRQESPSAVTTAFRAADQVEAGSGSELERRLLRAYENEKDEEVEEMLLELVVSSHLDSASKADLFNRFAPVADGPSVYPLYHRVLEEWGVKVENEAAFQEFVSHLDSPEIQENLAVSMLRFTTNDEVGLVDFLSREFGEDRLSYLRGSENRRVALVSASVDALVAAGSVDRSRLIEEIRSSSLQEEIKSKLIERIEPSR